MYIASKDDELVESMREWFSNNPITENLDCFGKSLKIPSAMAGKKHTEETKKILRLKNIGPKNKFYGKKHTEETKKRIGEKSRGRIPSQENLKKRSLSCSISKRKQWILISPEGTEHYTDNLKQFCKNYNLNYGNICSVSRGERSHNKEWKIKPYTS